MYNAGFTFEKIQTIMTTLTLQNVSFRYTSAIPVINNVSLTITDNERVAFIGHNGCGKSTLLQLVAGVLKPKSGKVLLNGKYLRTPLLYCSQNANLDLFLNMTIWENAVLWEGAFKEMRKGLQSSYTQELKRHLKAIHPTLTHVEKKVSNLSGGEKQLLLLALLIRRTPNALLLDEYTSALDPAFRTIVSEKVERFSKTSGVPSLTVTHTLSDILYATRFIALKGGEVFIDRPASQPPTQKEIAALYSHP